MSKGDVASRVEALAAAVVMADPHDLQAVSKMIELFKAIAGSGKSELDEKMKTVALAAVELAEEMIVQQGEEADASLKILGDTVSALQAALRDGPEEALKLVPAELGVGHADTSTVTSGADETILAEFLSRQDSVLEEMEDHILGIEKDGLASTKAGEFKRILHTLKGEAGMLGLADIQEVCHQTESYLEKAPQENLTDTLLQIKDWLAQTFEARAGRGAQPRKAENMLALLRCGAEGKSAAPQPVVEEQQEEAEAFIPADGDENLLHEFISEARSHLDDADVQLLTIENDPEDPEALNAIFRSFHTIKGGAGFLELEEVQKLAHIAEDLLDKARKGNLALSGSVIDTIFDSVDTMRRLIDGVEEALAEGGALAADPSMPSLLARLKDVVEGRMVEFPPQPVDPEKKLGEILVESGRVEAATVTKALSQQGEDTKLGETLVKKGGIAAKEVAGALRAQKAARKGADKVKVKETIKIDTERLDKLLDAIGELVISESMVSHDEEILSVVSQRVTRNLSHLNKISRVVQELGMSMRMVPIRPTFQKMARLVRDLAKKAGKEVEFVTSGEDTDLDRSVVEKISDPLIHLIRNSVDHGIEDDPAERVRAGKPAVARIELRAFHQGGNIFIEIADDGRGLNREALLAKARERGLTSDGSEMSDREVFNLIFAPGFSTAKKITDVSGRGVGMDVVRRNIESLRGNIELTSELNEGTTVSMRLPLTLAIIDGLIIMVGSERYIVPTLSVVESLRPGKKDLFTVSGQGEVLSVRGALMPLFRIAKIFNISGAIAEPTEALTMVVEADGKRVALLVDSLIGQQQVVIKTLGDGLGKVQGISGGAIMADGHVGLIIDVSELVKLASCNGHQAPTATKAECMEEDKGPAEDSNRKLTTTL